MTEPEHKIGPYPSAYKQHGGEDSWVRPDGRHPDFIIRDFFKGSDWEERIEEMIQEGGHFPEQPSDDAPDWVKWRFVLYCIVGGLDYRGVAKWLSHHDSLDQAVEEAASYLDSPAT